MAALVLCLLTSAALSGSAAPAAPQPPLVDILQAELARNFDALRKSADPAPYFISYSVFDVETDVLSATLGAVEQSSRTQQRALDCTVRVGSRELDNYHLIDGDRPRFTAITSLPAEDMSDAISRLAWRETDRAWRAAAERYLKVKGSTQVKQDDAAIPDFSEEKPSVSFQTVPRPRLAMDEWSARLKRLSARFQDASGVIRSTVSLTMRREVKTLVTTEGTRLQHGRVFVRLMIMARGKAADGQDLYTSESFEATDPAGLPKEAALAAAVDRTARDLATLLRVQPVDPFVGPAILSGRAAGVFFHEIFGHRVEGHRQRDDKEGQTFANSVGQFVLPEFLSVVFDPTRATAAGAELNGTYAFDDEGVAAQPVSVVDKGILKTFLLSRSPIKTVRVSNGHGRRQPGLEVVARQSNLLVNSAKRLPDAELRKALIDEVKKQNKPYGLFFKEVTGGYTTTRRQGLQAFTVIPLVVYRVFPDGRPDEMVRGVDIVGTPLSSFSKILATGDRDEVFNGYCGAESGDVPVSAVSPALLVSEIEVQRKPAPSDRPPLLPKPMVSQEMP